MSRKAGTLLWNRQRLTLPSGSTSIDTGLQQPNKSFGDYSPNEPPLGVSAAPPGPADGTTPAARVQVIPMAPLGGWSLVTHGEPFVNPATGTVWVTFANANEGDVDINVLFWDPHSMVGPGEADPYNPPPVIII
jgi:hypothetical protein